jgi:hypothetical protein
MPHGGDQMRVYVGHVEGGDPSAHDSESLDVRWFPLGALPRWLFRLSREHIEDALADPDVPFEREQRLPWAEGALLACFLTYRRWRDRLRRHRHAT